MGLGSLGGGGWWAKVAEGSWGGWELERVYLGGMERAGEGARLGRLVRWGGGEVKGARCKYDGSSKELVANWKAPHTLRWFHGGITWRVATIFYNTVVRK